MKEKVIFLDLDGTLLNEKGQIPETAKEAVRKARENGNYVFICTGRSKAEIFDYIIEVGFDGIIGAAGSYIEVNGEVILHKNIEIKDVEEIVDYLTNNKIEFYLESNGGLFGSENCREQLIRLIHGKGNKEYQQGSLELDPFIEHLIYGEKLIREDINKISFLNSDIKIDSIIERFSSKFTVIPCTVPIFGENSGEISLLGVNKAIAIEKVLNHLNIGVENTFGYGDGINDIEMINYVKYGVAMGNAKDSIKEIANDITDSHDENGIFNSFKKYKLI